jgi:hypothetical protein
MFVRVRKILLFQSSYHPRRYPAERAAGFTSEF